MRETWFFVYRIASGTNRSKRKVIWSFGVQKPSPSGKTVTTVAIRKVADRQTSPLGDSSASSPLPEALEFDKALPACIDRSYRLDYESRFRRGGTATAEKVDRG